MFRFAIDLFSFIVGFLSASILWMLVSRARPLWDEVKAGLKQRQENSHTLKTSAVEENFRRITLRRAQGMHVAAQLFSLDEILMEPQLMLPPAHVDPGSPPAFEDVITQTLPYLPSWPEIAATYNAPTLSLPQALSGNANIVIIGQPGAGKTVALAYLASLAANRSPELDSINNAIPLLYHVADLNLASRDLKDPLSPIVEAALEHAPMMDLGRLPKFIHQVFEHGRPLLLLDGFDELPAEEQSAVTEYLTLLQKSYPRLRIVTTGAPESLDGLIALEFVPLALMAWSKMKNENFLKHWGELWSQTIALESTAQDSPQGVDPLLLNNWISSEHVYPTPLELTLNVWSAYAGDGLGAGILDTIATHIRRIAPANTPLVALETLGMQVIVNAQPIFDARNAREWVKSFEVAEPDEDTELSEDSSAPSKKLRKNQKTVARPSSGLLGKMASSGLLSGSAEGRMRFSHPLFAGYLAGHALTNYNAIETVLKQPEWSGKQLTLRYFAARGDATRLAETFLESSSLPGHRPLFTVARWLRDAPKEAPWRGKVFSALASLLQTNGLPLGLRAQAMAAFVLSNDPGAAALFRQVEGTNSFELLQLALLGSGALHDGKALKSVMNAMSAPSLSVKRAACMALVAIGTNEALETVAHTLLSGDEDIRRAAGEALANDPHEGYAMLKDGITLSDILLRRAVVYGLGRIHEPWAVDLLKKVQIEDDQWIVRNAATEALDAKVHIRARVPTKLPAPSDCPWLLEFAGKQQMGISPGAPATDILLLALKSDDPDVRLASLQYLKFSKSEGVLAQIYNAMYRDDPELREAAFNTLWEIDASGVKLPHPSQYGLG